MDDLSCEHPWDPWFSPSPAIPTSEPVVPPIAPVVDGAVPVDPAGGLPAWDAGLLAPVSESWPLVSGSLVGDPGALEAPHAAPGSSPERGAGDAPLAGLKALNAFHPAPPPVFDIDPATGRPYRAPLPEAVTGIRGGMPRPPRGFARKCDRCGKELEGGGRCPDCGIEFCDQCGDIKEQNQEGEMECQRCFGRGLHPWIQLAEWEQEG